MKRFRADFCVIGSGASGAVVAHDLVARGRSVCLIERGMPVNRRSYASVLRSAERAYCMTDSGWRKTAYPWTTCNLGGGTVFYGGASLRFREIDFEASRAFGACDLQVNFPIDYSALARFYEELETALGVSGSLGGRLPPCSSSHLLPAHPMTPEAAKLDMAARVMGLDPFRTPLAVRSVSTARGAACRIDSPCIATNCRCAKGDVVSAFLDQARMSPLFELQCGVNALRLEQDRRDRVTALFAISEIDGEEIVVEAKAFVIAANAAQSAALLLRSRTRWSPKGIGNECDLVGRGLSVRPSVYIEAVPISLARKRKPALIPVGPFSTFALTDFYEDEACQDRLGGLIYEARPAEGTASGTIRLECMIGDRPSLENRVWLQARSGREELHFHYALDSRDARRLDFLLSRAKGLLKRAGDFEYRVYRAASELGTGHLAGTCRAGADPRMSVVDAFGRVHTQDNVFVVDGSYLPFSGGVNPTLTIQANALRIARTALIN